MRPINLAHATGSERRIDDIGPEAGASRQRHVDVILVNLQTASDQRVPAADLIDREWDLALEKLRCSGLDSEPLARSVSEGPRFDEASLDSCREQRAEGELIEAWRQPVAGFEHASPERSEGRHELEASPRLPKSLRDFGSSGWIRTSNPPVNRLMQVHHVLVLHGFSSTLIHAVI
jgi:hypothetical protein